MDDIRDFGSPRHKLSIQVEAFPGRDAREDVGRRRGQAHILADARDVVGAVLDDLCVLRHGGEPPGPRRVVELGHELVVDARR